MTVFIAIAVVLILVAGIAVLWPLLRDPGDRAAIAAVAAALLLPGFVVFAYLAASNYDWSRPPVPATTAASSAPGPLDDAVGELEARLAANPGDRDGWLLLGSAYTALGRPDDAIAAYTEANRLAGGRDPDARLGVAEAQLLKDRAAITGDAGVTIEAVLAEVPDNPKALWYGGLVALARGDTAAAERRWTDLLARSPPPRIREIVEAQLAELRGEGAAPAAPPVAAAGGPTVTVRIEVDAAIGPALRDGAPLFVFVRDAAGGPPLAVVRRESAALPLVVTLSDADVMIPGRSLANLGAARIVARVANGGEPVARPGDAFGEAEWRPASGSEVRVRIDRLVGDSP
jgi:cytochrome c-type biogenesis protein CcmH